MDKKAQIIPVASGKGGVGKSIFTANLAAVLAKKNKKVIAIDLDLGGSNLYSYLGLNNINPGIGDYFREKKPLQEYLVKTPYEYLFFLPGEGRTPFLANIQYAQKIKLLKEIKKLEADYVILDLGAGTTFNTLDFFGLVKDGIIMTTFEYPAIMNTLTFMKNFLFRIILQLVKQNYTITKALKDVYKETSEENPVTYEVLRNIIAKHDSQLAQSVDEIYKSYTPKVIFNFGKAPEDLRVVEKIDVSIKKNLSLNVFYFGYIPYDEKINESVNVKKLFVKVYEDSLATGLFNNIADKFINNINGNIESSKKDLVHETYDYIKNWIL